MVLCVVVDGVMWLRVCMWLMVVFLVVDEEFVVVVACVVDGGKCGCWWHVWLVVTDEIVGSRSIGATENLLI